MTRVLLVEDDEGLALALAAYLERSEFAVTRAATLAEARRATTGAQDFGAVLLDWRLPDGEGIEWLRELRAAGPLGRVPVLMITSRADLEARVEGLESGADDYLVKPFEPRELLARLRAQTRETPRAAGDREVLRARAPATGRALELDRARRRARVDGADAELTRMAFELAWLLAAHPGRIFTREDLLRRLWGYSSFPTTRTVDSHVLQLRRALGDEWIVTARGVGYGFVEFTPISPPVDTSSAPAGQGSGRRSPT